MTNSRDEERTRFQSLLLLWRIVLWGLSKVAKKCVRFKKYIFQMYDTNLEFYMQQKSISLFYFWKFEKVNPKIKRRKLINIFFSNTFFNSLKEQQITSTLNSPIIISSFFLLRSLPFFSILKKSRTIWSTISRDSIYSLSSYNTSRYSFTSYSRSTLSNFDDRTSTCQTHFVAEDMCIVWRCTHANI